MRAELNPTSPGFEQDYAHISRYLPLQQQSRAAHSCNKSLSQLPAFRHSIHNQHGIFTPKNLNNVFLDQSIEGTPGKNMNVALESSFCEALIREKVDYEQVKKEALELQKQLEKSRKDYSKLLSQIDED